MELRIAVFWISLLSFLPQGNSLGKNGTDCRIGDWRKSPGICKPLRECSAAISNLRAGVNPTICSAVGPLVCCPTGPRISEEMCEGYQEILREHHGPTPLLPLSFLQNRPKEIQCFNFVNQLIVDGREAQQDELPYMAAVGWGQNTSDLQFGCGGTLISENFVLTAAHCITSSSERPTYVLLGDIRLKPDLGVGSGRRYLVKIAEHILHPAYRKPLTYNDIGLLRLERSVALSRSILPACLPQPHMRLELKPQVIASGWGRVGTGDEQSNTLQAVSLSRFGPSECNEHYNGDQPDGLLKYPQGIIRSQFCAGDRDQEWAKKDTCKGDSGGPLVSRNEKHRCVFYVLGITSFGPSICGLLPGIYTNVQSYLDFIEKHVWPEHFK